MRGNQQENTIWQRNLTNTVIIIVQRSVLVCVCGHFQQHFSYIKSVLLVEENVGKKLDTVYVTSY